MSQAAAFRAGRGILSAARRRLAGLVIVLLLAAGHAALALDITTTDGRTYRQCEIEKVEPDALRIMHADGAARIPYEKLPSDLQKKYFDPAKVAAYRQQFAVQQQQVAARAAEAERLREEAAARVAEEQRKQTAERESEEQQKLAAAQAEEELRLAARRNKAKIATGLAILAGAVALFLYFLPTIIARNKANNLAIFVFNLFFGWTFIGWVAALIWACTRDSALDMLARQHLSRANMQPPPPPPGGPYIGNQLPGQGQLQDGQSARGSDGGRYLQ